MINVTPARTHPFVPPGTPWRQRLRRISRACENAVRWLEEHSVGTIARWATFVVVSAIPTLQNFHVVESTWWLLPWAVALLLLFLLEHYRHGATLIRVVRGIGDINSSFGGSLDTVAHKFPAAKGCLSEEGSQGACVGFLHRIRDFAAFAYQVGPRPHLRATLAVPIVGRGGDVQALRVWAYDEPHGNRGYTTIPLYDGRGEPLGGAPAAFVSCDIQIVEDVHRMPGGHLVGATQRPYRSILSVPLSMRGPDGRPLAIVSVDADEPNFFDPETVLDRVMPLIAPVVNAIALTLRMRQPGVEYEFPK
jgi:hypothetical protein